MVNTNFEKFSKTQQKHKSTYIGGDHPSSNKKGKISMDAKNEQQNKKNE